MKEGSFPHPPAQGLLHIGRFAVIFGSGSRESLNLHIKNTFILCLPTIHQTHRFSNHHTWQWWGVCRGARVGKRQKKNTKWAGNVTVLHHITQFK